MKSDQFSNLITRLDWLDETRIQDRIEPLADNQLLRPFRGAVLSRLKRGLPIRRAGPSGAHFARKNLRQL